MRSLGRAVLTLGIGALGALSQAPLGFSPFALLLVAAGFVLLGRSPRATRAFGTGWLLGVGYFAVALRWIVQKGVSINTMSTKRANIAANFDIMDFSLSSVDMARIDALTHTGYRIVTSDIVPWAPDWD